jgi:hypothetical protein
MALLDPLDGAMRYSSAPPLTALNGVPPESFQSIRSPAVWASAPVRGHWGQGGSSHRDKTARPWSWAHLSITGVRNAWSFASTSLYIFVLNPLKTEFLHSSVHISGNTSRLRCKAQPVNAVWGNSRCLLWEPYETHRYTLWAECRVLNNIYKFSAYLTGNTSRLYYKAQSVNAV